MTSNTYPETLGNLSWSKSRTYDFNQSVLADDDYRNLCSIHIFLGQIKNNLYRLQLIFENGSIRGFLTQGTFDYSVDACIKTFEPLAELILWIENALDGYYPMSFSDMASFKEKLHQLEDVSKMLTEAAARQTLELGRRSPTHYTVVPAKITNFHTNIKQLEEKLDKMSIG